MTEEQFCARYGFEKTTFNRIKRLEIIPKKQEKIKAIEQAFKNENV
jgi:hypothetical protein